MHTDPRKGRGAAAKPQALRPEELPEEFRETGRGFIPSDVLGSYTGFIMNDPNAVPVQDADDL